MAFIDTIKEQAKQNKKTIVLPESMDERTYEAAETIIKEGIADIIIIGTKDEIDKYSAGHDLAQIKIIDPFDDPNRQKYIDKFVELRGHKGITPETADEILSKDYMYYAALMCKCGDADGAVSGACHSTADTLRPCLQIIKTKPGTKLVSAFFLMEVPDCEYGDNGLMLFADCALNFNPNSEELASIAGSSAESYKVFTGNEPKVAMLSYSTMGSASHDDVQKVQEAVRIAKAEYPDYLIDGELQLDAAIDKKVASIKVKDSKVAGEANVLVFPNLDAGNIGYKLVQRLGKAAAYGPVLQGIAMPVNDLSRGCSPDDIVGVVALTAVQAQQSI